MVFHGPTTRPLPCCELVLTNPSRQFTPGWSLAYIGSCRPVNPGQATIAELLTFAETTHEQGPRISLGAGTLTQAAELVTAKETPAPYSRILAQ